MYTHHWIGLSLLPFSLCIGRSPVHLYGERFDDILDDSALPELDDSQLERLLNRLVVRVILQLAQIAATCGNLVRQLR